MPTIDFYVLSDSAPDAHFRQACRIAEQAVDQGQRVFVRVASEDLKRMDDLLWTFGDRSFLPHEIAGSSNHQPSNEQIRILIGSGEPPASFRDLCINLSSDIPSGIDSLQRIAELVPVDAERKRLAREHFKKYRDGGVEPATHNV